MRLEKGRRERVEGGRKGGSGWRGCGTVWSEGRGQKLDITAVTVTWIDMVGKKFLSELEVWCYAIFHLD